MKKETVILMVVVAFVVGFVTGATVAILRGSKGAEISPVAQKPQAGPMPSPKSPDSLEVASKIQSLKDIVKKNPKDLLAWAELGNLYFDSGQAREAIQSYSQYLAIKPENPDVRTDMGIMYRTLGDFNQAIEELKKAAESDHKHANSRYNIGIVLLHDKGDVEGAIQAWEEYLRVDPNSERAQRVRAQMEKLRKMVK